MKSELQPTSPRGSRKKGKTDPATMRAAVEKALLTGKIRPIIAGEYNVARQTLKHWIDNYKKAQAHGTQDNLLNEPNYAVRALFASAVLPRTFKK